MTGTNHGITGAVIALLVKEPVIAVPLSFLSHFVCDAIPHFGMRDHPGEPDNELFTKKYNIILVSDFLFAVGLMVLFGIWFPAERWLIWSCMVAAAVPDVMSAYTRLYLERIKNQRYDPKAHFSSRIQWSQTTKGAYVELAWFLAMGTVILSFR
jgi:hypothetical protein